jgi:hypothetical protein
MKTMEQSREFYLFNSCVAKTCEVMQITREDILNDNGTHLSKKIKSIFYFVCKNNLLKLKDIQIFMEHYGCKTSLSSISRFVNNYEKATEAFPTIRHKLENIIAF